MVLFGALTWAITKSTRNDSGSNREIAILQSAKFIEFAGKVEAAITRMKLASGCTDTQISFEHPLWAHPDPWGGSGNSAAPADKSCHLFNPAGGGLVVPDFTQVQGLQYQCGGTKCPLIYSGKVGIVDVGVTGDADLLIALQTDRNPFTKTMCEYMNNQLGYGSAIPGATIRVSDWYNFTSGYSHYATSPLGSGAGLIGSLQPTLAGRRSGCLAGGNDGSYYLMYQVVLAR